MNTDGEIRMRRKVFMSFIVVSTILIIIIIGKAAIAQSFIVCHGEFEAICRQHDFTWFEHCGNDNGVSGADPRATAIRLCGSGRGPGANIEPVAQSIPGNHCGYSWFRITCPN